MLQEQQRLYGALFALRILTRKYEFKDEEERAPLGTLVDATFPTLLSIFQARSHCLPLVACMTQMWQSGFDRQHMLADTVFCLFVVGCVSQSCESTLARFVPACRVQHVGDTPCLESVVGTACMAVRIQLAHANACSSHK